MSTQQLAPMLGVTPDALTQDRHRTRGHGIGRRVRYLRSDVVRYLLANRHGGAA